MPENRLFQYLRSASVYLGRYPSGLYALLYLVAIPAFAGLFLWRSDEFYHSTVKYEHSLRDDEQAMADLVLTSWVKHYREVYGSAVAESNGWEVALDAVKATFKKCDERSVTFDLDLVMKHKPGEPNELRGDGFELVVGRRPATYRPDLTPAPKDPSLAYFPARAVVPQAAIDLTKFDPMKLMPLKSLFEGQGLITLPLTFVNDTDNYRRALDGLPSGSSGSYGRMLYLSVVTITTLGYGDIVPVSTATRWMVGVEAITGIVLVGLFLNAISQEVGRAMTGRPGTEATTAPPPHPVAKPPDPRPAPNRRKRKRR
jgi:hypothetical protein